MSLIRNTQITGTLDANNSTTTPLGISGVFTGTATEVLGGSTIAVSVTSDVASATDGLEVQQSTDSTNWDFCDEYTINAGSAKNFSINPHARYYRIVYTNGTVAQTFFRLQAVIKSGAYLDSSHRIQDPISEDDDARLRKSIITGKKDNGDFDNASLTNKGQFKVSIEEYGDTPSVDAFARLRISDNFTLFDSKQLHDKQPLFWDEEIGGSATSTHDSTNADVEMVVTANASDYVIRQSKQRFNYQPGKSQLAFMTFRSPQNTGVTCRVGMFDDDGTGSNLTPNNGIFFKCDGDLTWNIAKNGTTTESVSQDNWNVDKLDGTGTSGITLDTDATQILIIDYEWLGVGRVRVGFVIDGLIVYCHYFKHANDDTFTSVYMSTPNLPLRYDIQTDGTSGGELDHICSTVISEGGQQKTGILRSIESRNTLTSTLGGGTGTKHALCGLRLKTAYKDVSVIPESVEIVLDSNDNFKWELHLNPTINGTWTYSDLTNSSVQFAQVGSATNNTISADGIILARGGGSDRTRTTSADLETALRIGSTIAGTQDELVLVLGLLTNNITCWGCLNFRELL